MNKLANVTTSTLWTILCLILRTTVTSLSASKNTRCKTHPLCVNPGVPFWTWENTQVAHAMTSVFLRNTRWCHGRSRGETKYSWKSNVSTFHTFLHFLIKTQTVNVYWPHRWKTSIRYNGYQIQWISWKVERKMGIILNYLK